MLTLYICKFISKLLIGTVTPLRVLICRNKLLYSRNSKKNAISLLYIIKIIDQLKITQLRIYNV